MIGIIVAGHGNFASGITSMLELVVGKPENYEYIDFLQGESQEALENDFREKLNNLKDCEKIVIMILPEVLRLNQPLLTLFRMTG